MDLELCGTGSALRGRKVRIVPSLMMYPKTGRR